jgi:hypothetical protein
MSAVELENDVGALCVCAEMLLHLPLQAMMLLACSNFTITLQALIATFALKYCYDPCILL